MVDESQNQNQATPTQDPAPTDPVPNLAPSGPTPPAPPPSVPPKPSVPSQTVDPIASAPPPVTTGGVQMPQPTAATSYGGFWIRFLALIIDSVLLGIVTSIINSVLGVGFAFTPSALSKNPSAGTAGLFAGLFGLAFVIQFVINYSYFVILTGLYGATLGKRVLGLRVVDANGQKIGVPKAALREIVGKLVSALVFSLGYLWVAFDEKKQGWHDKIAGTYVVKIK